MSLRLFSSEPQINFLSRKSLVAFACSGLILLASVLSLAFNGLNLGIDFAGGVLIEAETPKPADLKTIRAALDALDLGDVAVSAFGTTGRDISIRIAAGEEGDAARQSAVLSRVKEALGEELQYNRSEVVGPKVGAEMIADGVWAVSLALLGIGAYVWVRFEWQFALGALLALVHDVVATLGLFSILWLDFDLTIVAALLTIAGYSINDTVVEYDRARENFRLYKDMPSRGVLNKSLNQTLRRTLLTSTTTALAAIALLAFGGDVLRGFSITIVWGVVVGTYSSIFIAMPILLAFDMQPFRDDGPSTGSREARAARGDGAQV